MKRFFLQFIFLSCLLSGFFIAPQIIFAQNKPNLEKIFYLSEKNAEEGLKSVQKNWEKIDIVAPQIYSVKSDLNLYGKLDEELKKTAQEHNLKIMPLVVNEKFNRKIMHNLLLSQKAQDKIIGEMVATAKKNKYIGWQFDFENIYWQDRDLFTAFVQKTYAQFQKNGLVFSVAVVPRFTEYENTDMFKNWSGAYDYKAIAQSSDFVSLMVYDDPKSLGPVASLDFAKKCLAYIKNKIPAEKISFGVPLYFWKWDAGQNKRIGSGAFKTVLDIMETMQSFVVFDSSLGVASLSYTDKNKNYKIWFENKDSLQAKLDLIKANSLRGFSAWVLGGEDPKIWTLF